MRIPRKKGKNTLFCAILSLVLEKEENKKKIRKQNTFSLQF